MSIKWFKHGKWPKWLVGLHHYTIGSFILLAATGLALYLPSVHTVLIPYLRLIYDVHILLGLVFTVTLITPFLKLFPTGKRIWRFDWGIPLLFGGPLALTGIMLWGVALFPTTVRAPAFTWHGWFTLFFGAWILIHAIYKAFGIRPQSDGVAGRVDPERRMFLKWAGTGLAGAVVLTVLDPFALLSRALSRRSVTRPSRTTSTTTVQRFPAYYTVTYGYPEMTTENYRLKVGGNVATVKTLNWSEIQALPSIREVKDFHCVTGWSVPSVHWEGVHISQLVSLVSPKSSVRYVHFYSFDGQYSECLTLQEALDPSVLLAYKMDGEPLQQSQGYPLRLLVPKMFGYKSIKWVNRVEFSDQPITGYWEQRGYPTEAYF